MIIPGSHKANFPIPAEIAECDKLDENNYLVNPALNPGKYTLCTVIVNLFVVLMYIEYVNCGSSPQVYLSLKMRN